MHSAQEHIQQLLNTMIHEGKEDGLQVAAYLDGKLVIHAHAGMADPTMSRLVDEQTLFLGMSTGKALTATVIHRLAQAGKLDYDDPIANYWPSFAANGKATITIRHVLCHTAGIPQMPKHVTMEMICDWDVMRQEMEKLTPLWEPGTKTGYHVSTFGWILGEVAQRIDGRPFARIVHEDIREPLGLSNELFFGVPQQTESRVAKVRSGKKEGLIWRLLPSFFLIKRAIPACIAPMGNPTWDQSRFQRAVIPAGNAVMTAHALARFYAALIGDIPEVPILSADQLARACTLQTVESDQVLDMTIPKGLGYWLGGKNEAALALGSDRRVFGHFGTGGCIGFADPVHHFTFALLKNRLTVRGAHETDVQVANAVRHMIDVPE